MKNILSTYVYYLVMLVIVGIILVSLYFTYIWNNNQSPNQDKYQDRILEANGEKDEAFKVFAGNDPIEHSLYLTCPEIFNLPELANLQLILTTDNTNQFPSTRMYTYLLSRRWLIFPKTKWGVLFR